MHDRVKFMIEKTMSKTLHNDSLCSGESVQNKYKNSPIKKASNAQTFAMCHNTRNITSCFGF